MSPDILAVIVGIAVVVGVALLAFWVWRRGGPHSDQVHGSGS